VRSLHLKGRNSESRGRKSGVGDQVVTTDEHGSEKQKLGKQKAQIRGRRSAVGQIKSLRLRPEATADREIGNHWQKNRGRKMQRPGRGGMFLPPFFCRLSALRFLGLKSLSTAVAVFPLCDL